MFTRKLLVPAVLLLGFGLACAGGSTEEAPADATPAATPAATTLQGAGTLASPYILSCDNSAKDIVGDPGLKAHVTCPANCTTGSVWGVNPYTRDSRVCSAAVHSGAIPVTGGTAEMSVVAGQSAYEGSASNAVTSRSWGSYDTSFSFVVAAAAPAAAPEAAPVRESDPLHKRSGDGRPNRPMKRN
jgi:LCCL domain